MSSDLGYLELLKTRPDYRRLWLGEVVSYLGDWFNTIAVYTSVQALSGSAQAVAAVMIAKTLPAFLISPVAGPLIDRFDRKKLLIASDLARAGCVGGLILSHHVESIVGLLAFTTLMILFSGIVLPTRNAVLPMIVKPQHIPVANALGGGTWSIMLAIGSALGGFATEWLGITAAFVIDGVTFLLSAFFFAGLPNLLPPGEKRSKKETSFIEGLRYLFRTPYILAVAALKPMMALTSGAIVLVPLFGKHLSADEGALYIGLIYASRGIGAMTGSLVVRVFVGDAPKTLRRMILTAYFVIAGGYYIVSSSGALPGIALGYFVAAVGSGTIWVFSGTLLQLEGDRAYHGRVFSLEFGLVTLVISVSSWVLSFLVDQGLSLFEAAGLAAGMAAFPILVWSLTLIVSSCASRSRPREGGPYTG